MENQEEKQIMTVAGALNEELVSLHREYKRYTLAILNTIKTCAVSDLNDVIKAIEMDTLEDRVLEKLPSEQSKSNE